MRHRSATRLSGGEQARVLIARALAQDAPLLMADEPTPGSTRRTRSPPCRPSRRLAEQGKSALVSLHDMSLAARHCTRLVMLDAGASSPTARPARCSRPSGWRRSSASPPGIATPSMGRSISRWR